MGLMERLNEIAKELPDTELAEVLNFAEALQAKHSASNITAPDAAIDIELMHAVRLRCRGKFIWWREDMYDRGLR